jgi:hypothetical protein
MLESTTTLTRSIPPGDDVEVEITVWAGGSVESGERYQLRFEMGLEDDPGGWVGFSELEASRPWPTYDVRFCIDACRTHLPLVVKNWPNIYFSESFNPPHSGWVFYTVPLSGNISSYVNLNSDGHTDNASLFIKESFNYGGGAKIIIPVPVNEPLEVSFWHKRQTAGVDSRFNVKIDNVTIISDRGSGDSWEQLTSNINASHTTDGLITLTFEVPHVYVLRYKVLLDDISICNP